MCGIVGFFGHPPVDKSWLDRACRAMRHRGPDASGAWLDQDRGVALGHTRLAIIDLSASGAQPMVSPSGRYVLSFNGEIYNHLELRGRVRTRNWRGGSDTETLLALIEEKGVDGAVGQLVGMFAFAVFDSQTDSVTLVRDRLGEKPLYYGLVPRRGVLFGSELKALRIYPEFPSEISRRALSAYMHLSFVPSPLSIYESVKKLEAGTILRVDRKHLESSTLPEPQAYWSAAAVALSGQRAGETENAQWVESLDRHLRRVVRGQMMADVPLGAFLSGGIDSSLVVAMMQAEASSPVRTFSVGFREAAFDEAAAARRIAEHLGTDHTEFFVGADEALATIPQLSEVYDEPFADSSQIPTLLISRLARQHVTVVLSGDGGDELFGGYNRYSFGRAVWPLIRPIPRSWRIALARLVRGVSPKEWDTVYGLVEPAIPKRFRVRMPGDKMHKFSEVMALTDGQELYDRLIGRWWRCPVVLGAGEPPSRSLWEAGVAALDHRMMLADATGYLPDDILVKVDRASMAVSLETRVPFLDHRLFEFAWSLPGHLKLRGNQGKWILRQVLRRYLPAELFERPKMGFAVPLDEWLRGPLRDWVEDLITHGRLRDQGFLDPTLVRQRWSEHLSGRRSWDEEIWNVVMFQSWLDAQT